MFFMARSCDVDLRKLPIHRCFLAFFLIHLKVIINQMVDTARQLSHLLVFCSSSIMVLIF